MSGAGRGAQPMAGRWRGACGARNAPQNPRGVWPSAALNKPCVRAGHGGGGYGRRGHLHPCWGPAGRQTKLLPAAWGPPGLQCHQPGGQGDSISHVCPRSSHAAEAEPHPCHAERPLTGPRRWLWQGPSGELNTRLRPGMASPQGEKAPGEPNSLYLWITTAAFNSLE